MRDKLGRFILGHKTVFTKALRQKISAGCKGRVFTFTDYIEFLGSRYCPVGADNDPQGLNKNWVKNVKYFLTKKEG